MHLLWFAALFFQIQESKYFYSSLHSAWKNNCSVFKDIRSLLSRMSEKPKPIIFSFSGLKLAMSDNISLFFTSEIGYSRFKAESQSLFQLFVWFKT